MKQLNMLVGVALLLASADLASVAFAGGDKDKLDKTEYFPLKIGTKWEYQSAGKKIVIEVKAHEMVGSMWCARLETDSGGSPLTEHLTVKDGGVYRVKANNQMVEPPFLIVKLPPKAGEKWENKCVILANNISGTLAMSQDKVKVLNAEYDTFLVTATDLKIGGQDAQMKQWFNKDLGMVKQTFSLPNAGVDVMLELEKFTPGK
jgi:hypothetical protein